MNEPADESVSKRDHPPATPPATPPAVAEDDPRAWITPEHLNVAPDLLGLPLARPSRRALAMGLDLALLALLSHLDSTLLLVGFVWLGWRWHKRQQVSRGQVLSSGRGWGGWAPGVLLVVLGLYTSVSQLDLLPERAKERAAEQTAAAEDAVDLRKEVGDAVVSALAEAAEAGGDELPARASQAASAASAALMAAGASAAGATDAKADTKADAKAAAQRLEGKAQRQRIRALEAEVRQLKDEAQLDPREKLRRWWDKVGLNLAWALAYFVMWPLIWTGQTPGKRLLGLRVVELTGKPPKPMLNLRRYGGYAAGMATGGMGFLQILWDGNRQGLHDKAAHTAVIDLRNPKRLRLQD